MRPAPRSACSAAVRTGHRARRRRALPLATALVSALLLLGLLPSSAEARPGLVTQQSCPTRSTRHRVMTTTKLTSAELVHWYRSMNKTNRATASIQDLANAFIAEGALEGVAGDWAFAQTMVETGYLGFSAYVPPHLNNFAGIGAVGGGVPPNRFPTAGIGIRAQIQHLRAYADRTVTPARLARPLVDPRFAYVTKGIAPYWEQYGKGIWAADPCYFDVIYGVRQRMGAHARAHRRFSPFVSRDALILVGYDSMAKRSPSAQELASVRAALDAGTDTPIPFLTRRMQQTTPYSYPVVRTYLAALGRAPDGTWFDRRVRQRRAGASDASLALGLVGSAEFRSRYGTLNDDQFVDRMYRNALGRVPSAAERSAWVARLRGGAADRGAVAVSFGASAESVRRNRAWTEISVAYLSMFRFTPPSAMVSWWAGQLAAGRSLTDLVARLYDGVTYREMYS